MASLRAFLFFLGVLACQSKQPNFIVILTDDQDYLMNSSHRAYMPNLHTLVGDPGLECTNFAVSMAWCCPSRVSLLTGKLVHNSNITSSQLPNGERASRPAWMVAFGVCPIGHVLVLTWLVM